MSTTAPANLLSQDVEYRFDETAWGTWRRFLYSDGSRFEEFTSHRSWFGLPVLHYTFGKCPESGKRITAHGVVAIGRVARGIVAIGQAAFGVVAIGQLAVGILLSIGQAAVGGIAIAQLAIGLVFGFGQFATGYIVIAQFALGYYVLALFGFGRHIVDVNQIDPVAKEYFLRLFGR